MEEHIIVLDEPPQFGKGIPAFYKIQVFDVPIAKKVLILKMLEDFGFVEINEAKCSSKNYNEINNTMSGEQPCILANYHIAEDKLEYEVFWEKKEKLENVIDSLHMKLTNEL